MKALEWQRYLDREDRRHHKRVFTVAELANVANVTPHALNVQLGRLVQQGVIVRYARGRYGLPGRVAPEDLVGSLDSGAYITGLYALYRHNLVLQSSRRITCFTNRRHNRSRTRDTPIGTFSFVCVRSRIYQRPAEGSFASPEQALYDWVYMSSRRGIDPVSQVSFRSGMSLREEVLTGLQTRYPKTVTRRMNRVLEANGIPRRPVYSP